MARRRFAERLLVYISRGAKAGARRTVAIPTPLIPLALTSKVLVWLLHVVPHFVD